MIESTPTDMRRAAALACHFQAGDTAGLREILTEAAQADAVADLAAALLALLFDSCPALLTDEGGRALRELVRSYAAAEARQNTDGTDGC